MDQTTDVYSNDTRRSSHDQAVDASRRTRERMLKAMRVLETALAKASVQRETAWRTRVVTALIALEETMRRQAAELKGQRGLLAELLQEAPRLEHRILRLRSQYEDLVRQIGSLREEFSGAEKSSPSNVGDIRQRLAWLLTALRHFQSGETDLIYEAIQVDIGEVD